MKNKEEILNDCCDEQRDSWSTWKHMDFFDGAATTVFKAMDEYSKQECLSIIYFLQANYRLMEDEGSADKLYEYYLQTKLR